MMMRGGQEEYICSYVYLYGNTAKITCPKGTGGAENNGTPNWLTFSAEFGSESSATGTDVIWTEKSL